jgi:hypothetical protein
LCHDWTSLEIIMRTSAPIFILRDRSIVTTASLVKEYHKRGSGILFSGLWA